MNILSRYHLRSDKRRELIEDLRISLNGFEGLNLKKRPMEVIKTEKFDEIIFFDGKAAFFRLDGKYILTLKGAIEFRGKGLDLGLDVVVDMGAVRFISNGADVMAPGVVEADERIKEGEMVIVVDETHKMPLGIGIALKVGKEMEKGKGKVVKSLHHVGDDLWNL